MKLTLHESQAGIGKTRLGRAQERSEMVEQNKPSGDFSQLKVKHVLKTKPCYFERILSGEMTYQVRACVDREFEDQQIVTFAEWEDQDGYFTGRAVTKKIHGVELLSDIGANIARGYVAFSLLPIEGGAA